MSDPKCAAALQRAAERDLLTLRSMSREALIALADALLLRVRGEIQRVPDAPPRIRP